MQITITVADKIIKTAIGQAIEYQVYDQYDEDILKAAKLPKTSELIKEIFADAKFQKDLTKHLTRVAVEAVEDCAYQDLSYEIDLPLLDSLKDKLDTITEEEQEAFMKEREAKEVKRMVEALERAGFKISKA